MRVTTNSFPDRLIQQLGDLGTRQTRLQGQAATGQRVTLPEDDPAAMRRVLDMQAEARTTEQYATNIGRLQEAATASYNAMKSLKTLNDKASEIAVLATNGTRSPGELTVYANQIDEFLQQAVLTANATYRGDYLFAGTCVDQPPFVVTKDAQDRIVAVTYNGNANALSAEISQNVLSEAQPVGANDGATGSRGLLADARAGADVFAHLISLRDHLMAGDKQAVKDVDRVTLKKDEDNYLYHFGHNGALQSRLEAAASLASSQAFAIDQQVSGLVDADLAQTLVRLNQVQNAYTAALQTGGSILGSTLLDYLR